MPKYLVLYTLAGGIEIDAETEEEAIKSFLGDGEFEEHMPISDAQMIDGISRSCGYIDGDAIAVEAVEQLEGDDQDAKLV